MGGFAYDFARVGELSGQWTQQVSYLEGFLDEQRADIAKLSAAWAGDTGDAFRREQAAWQKQADALLRAARKVGQLLANAGQDMAQAEQHVQARLGEGGDFEVPEMSSEPPGRREPKPTQKPPTKK
ncbi:WXG100 family type VII secretion target [Mycobacteroides immunogenum]|uniref:WXG100 family type VII secretion target n=1 Tax=Mycobacteroides immunogenum TaxID=83262 RepID=UPI0025B7988E|nr:WXG100 family type VII secretion target [Mycobacteroides immunogenum]WJR35889.1 WXG100 family type VII secretion target [Mycobacteroides immunogenum]